MTITAYWTQHVLTLVIEVTMYLLPSTAPPLHFR